MAERMMVIQAAGLHWRVSMYFQSWGQWRLLAYIYTREFPLAAIERVADDPRYVIKVR